MYLVCVIIRSPASVSTTGAPVATTGSSLDPMTYEEQRSANIQRNNDMLNKLGIPKLKIGSGDAYDSTKRPKEDSESDS